MQGTAVDIAIHAKEIIYTKKIMAERIAFHTGQTVEQVLIDSDRDRWFTAEEARDYGIIDHVIERSRQVDGGVVSLQGGGVDGAGRRVPPGLARAFRLGADQAGHVVAVGEERLDEGTADQPVRAGDDHTHGGTRPRLTAVPAA
jgi:hypothetical protein